MAELAEETPDAAIRAYLFAIGFTLVLVGGDMMAEKIDPRSYTGLFLVIVALPVHLAWVFWKKLKPHLGKSVLSQAGVIAGSLRWWLGVLLILLAAAVLSPFVEERRWPFSEWFPPGPTLDQTASAIADKLAARPLSFPTPAEIAEAVSRKLPKQMIAPSADEIATAVINKSPRLSAADITKEIARSFPQLGVFPTQKIGTAVADAVAPLNATISQDKTAIAALTERLNGKTQELLSVKKNSVPSKLLFALQPIFSETTSQQAELTGIAEKYDRAEAENGGMHRMQYFVPQCRMIISSTANNMDFANAI